MQVNSPTFFLCLPYLILPKIFHYAKGQPYIDDIGAFKERIQWIGNPRWKDGSIIIHDLEYTDNGTFTCDVKNPPDIVGKSSQTILYVFETGKVSIDVIFFPLGMPAKCSRSQFLLLFPK